MRRASQLSFGLLLAFVAADIYRQIDKHEENLLKLIRELGTQNQSQVDDEKAKQSTQLSLRQNRANVVVFVCDRLYCPAVASSVISLRKDGGYNGDVAVIIDVSANYTEDAFREDLHRDSEEYGDLNLYNNSLYLYSASNLLDDLDLGDNHVEHIREAPSQPPEGCDMFLNKRPYYLKALVWHPAIADRWNRALFMDACMTIHGPHIDKLFEMSQIEDKLLASPDPWRWGQKMLIGKTLASCRDSLASVAEEQVGRPLSDAPYFASGLMLYDTNIVRNYGTTSSATLVELLDLYHKLAYLFKGDQEIFSVYWVYKRHQFEPIPLELFGTNWVPYEFHKRIPRDPHVITVGHRTRPVCLQRPTNNITLS